MFRLGKRNFSLRESPNKLASLSPGPRLQTNSPAKRLRLGECPQFLSSTFLSESRIDVGKTDQTIVGEISISKDKENLDATCNERSSLQQISPPVQQEIQAKVPVETPPSTPEIKQQTRYDSMVKHKQTLKEQGAQLDKDIEAKIQLIEACTLELESSKATRYKYEDYVTTTMRGLGIIRDLLNEMFHPGLELGTKLEAQLQELSSKHTGKFEQKCLEWYSWFDQSTSAISKKIEDLNHEMDIHQRILLHKEHSKAQEEENQKSAEMEEAVRGQEPKHLSETEPETGPERNVSQDERKEPVEDQEADDCVILEPASDSNVGHEEIITEHSITTERADNDETDIEEVNSEEVRSFTPCQAQRPE